MNDIKIKVVNSTVGLGNTEYSLCDGRGLLKFDKGAMDECCQMINNHDAMAEQIEALKAALESIKTHQETLAGESEMILSKLAVYQIAVKALKESEK